MRYGSFGNALGGHHRAVRLPIGFAGGLYDADTGLTRFVWRAPFGVHDRATAPIPGRKGRRHRQVTGTVSMTR